MIMLNQNQCVNRQLDVDTIVGIIHHAVAHTFDHHVIHIVEDHGWETQEMNDTNGLNLDHQNAGCVCRQYTCWYPWLRMKNHHQMNHMIIFFVN